MKKRYYLLSILILFLINIGSINALETNFENLQVQGYNNNGNSLTTPSVFNCSTGTCGMEITTVANSYGGAWGIQSPIPLVQGHQYAITLRIRTSNGTISLSSKPNIAIGSQMTYAKNNYENSDYYCETNYSKSIGNQTLQYIIKPELTLNYLIIPFTTTSNTTANFFIDNIIVDDLGATPLSENQINNALNNQTTIIQNDINSLNDNINTSLNDLEDNINNTINDTFLNCENPKNLWYSPNFTSTYAGVTTTYNNNHFNLNGFREWTGWIFENSPSTYLDPGTYTFSIQNYQGNFDKALSLVLDVSTSSGNILDLVVNNSTINNKSGTFTLSTGSDVYFNIYANSNNTNFNNVRFNIQIEKGNSVTSFTPYCQNRLDSLNQTQKETNDKLDDLNDNITNSDSSGASGDAENFFSNFSTDTFGLTSVITAPLELIKSVTSKTCTPLHGNLPFVDTEINLPCLTTIYESHFGSFLTIYRTITFGFVSYWVCIKIFNLVKDFKNPEHDEIEVLDL